MEPILCAEIDLRPYCFDCPLLIYLEQLVDSNEIYYCEKYRAFLDYYDGPLRVEKCVEEYGE